MTLKRDLVKYVRDKAKSKYKKEAECYICGSTENLDFHHFYGFDRNFKILFGHDESGGQTRFKSPRDPR